MGNKAAAGQARLEYEGLQIQDIIITTAIS
jgi:hypothetical protein